MGPFPASNGYTHILVVVDYVGTLFLGFVSCSTNHDRIQSQFMGFVDRGDVPPPLQIPQPSREVHKHPNAHDQVNVSIPPFNGRFKPALYIVVIGTCISHEESNSRILNDHVLS